MKTEMNISELEQVSGGNFIEDAAKYIKENVIDVITNIGPKPVIAKKDPVFKSMPELG